MTNAALAAVFEEIAEILEFRGENPFRVRAYRNAARAVADHAAAVAEIARENPEQLTAIKGVGSDLAAKLVTLVTTGELPFLQELRQQIPESVLALLRIPHVGPKKAAALHKELGIQSLEELRAACEAGRVRGLKGFGAKSEEQILHGLAIATQAQQRWYWADADAIVTQLREHFRDCPTLERLEFAGSYRRGRDTVGDLDLLVIAEQASIVMDHFARFPLLAETIGRGDTKMSVRLQNGLQLDLRVVPAAAFGAAWQYFTGSKEHNVVVRGRAKQLGLKVNEYGVWRVSGETETRVAGATEEEVYASLGLPCFPPELREARQEFLWAEQNALPQLIEVDDLRGDLHMHTTATDGAASLEEMVAAAHARGLEYIAITDHSRRVTMARGLTPERLRAQWREIDALRPNLPEGFTLLKGIECDILEKGGLDLPDDVLAEADWVLASVHYGQQQSREQITERILEAIAHPHVSAIAHPTGRLLNRREPYAVDLDAVFQACARFGKLLEINAHPARLDLHDSAAAAAKSHGIPLVINTDAHSVADLALLRYGVLQARRAGLTCHDIANTRSWPELRALIGRSKVQ